MTTYPPEYFLEKFEAIPEELWCTGSFQSFSGAKYCALGHCGLRKAYDESKEADELCLLFIDAGLSVVEVNDGKDSRYPQPTPKLRILAALTDIIKKQS